MVLILNELKQIRDKRNEIEDIKNSINNKLNNTNEIVMGSVENILFNVDGNLEISRDSLYSIYDFNDEPSSKRYMIDNFKFINDIKSMINFNELYVDNYEHSFSIFMDKFNDFIVNQLTIDNEFIDMSYYNEDIIKYLKSDNFDEYMEYLDNIYDFYYSLDNVVDMLKVYC